MRVVCSFGVWPQIRLEWQPKIIYSSSLPHLNFTHFILFFSFGIMAFERIAASKLADHRSSSPLYSLRNLPSPNHPPWPQDNLPLMSDLGDLQTEIDAEYFRAESSYLDPLGSSDRPDTYMMDHIIPLISESSCGSTPSQADCPRVTADFPDTNLGFAEFVNGPQNVLSFNPNPRTCLPPIVPPFDQSSSPFVTKTTVVTRRVIHKVRKTKIKFAQSPYSDGRYLGRALAANDRSITAEIRGPSAPNIPLEQMRTPSNSVLQGPHMKPISSDAPLAPISLFAIPNAEPLLTSIAGKLLPQQAIFELNLSVENKRKKDFSLSTKTRHIETNPVQPDAPNSYFVFPSKPLTSSSITKVSEKLLKVTLKLGAKSKFLAVVWKSTSGREYLLPVFREMLPLSEMKKLEKYRATRMIESCDAVKVVKTGETQHVYIRRFASRLTLPQMAAILGLQGYGISLTKDVESSIIKMFDQLCQFRVGETSWRSVSPTYKATMIERVYAFSQIYFPTYSKEIIGVIMRRASYAHTQSLLRKNRRAERRDDALWRTWVSRLAIEMRK